MADGTFMPREHAREPLWDRVDRNRYTVAAFTAGFIVLCALALAFVAGTIVAVGWLLSGLDEARSADEFFARWRATLPSIYLATLAGGAALATGWAVFARVRSEAWVLRRLAAAIVPRGELLETKMAVKDMAIAAGRPVAPALYVMETRNVNAFVYDAPRRRPIIGITRGLAERLTVDQQRAVFAHLMARIESGMAASGTAMASLMEPVWLGRDLSLRDDDEFDADGPPRDETNGAGIVLFLLGGFALTIVSELMAHGHREAQLRGAERADAEAMLLLKDPRSMLSALSRCVELNNTIVAAGAGLSDMFFCWAGWEDTDDEHDVEWRRVARMREVLGVEGAKLD